MAIYEVNLVGNSDATEEADNLLLWIEASSIHEVESLLKPISALIDGAISMTDQSGIGKEDGLDLTNESTAEDVIQCVSEKYSFITDLYLTDYNLNSELSANHIAKLCDVHVNGFKAAS
jgi:hypothetical protein